jgi:hypothetical protein
VRSQAEEEDEISVFHPKLTLIHQRPMSAETQRIWEAKTKNADQVADLEAVGLGDSKLHN